MKSLTLILILFSLSLPALAQTQTNCQVFGNQINCTSTSPPPPPQVQTPQPSISPDLIRALAEKRAQEFAAAEAARQAAVEKFEAELSAPDVWTSVRTGSQFHVRMTNDRIYLQWIPNPGASEGIHSARECFPANGGWTCKIYSDRSFAEHKWTLGCNLTPERCWKTYWCHFEDTDKITFVSLERIELEGDSADKQQDYDIHKCVVKHTTHKTVTLIPREVPKP